MKDSVVLQDDRLSILLAAGIAVFIAIEIAEFTLNPIGLYVALGITLIAFIACLTIKPKYIKYSSINVE